MTPANRSALILFIFAFSGVGLSTYWVYREAARVKKERDDRRRVSSGDTGDMVLIKATRFTMGSDDGGDDELPKHDVKIRAFWMDRTEVTNAEFERFVKATGYLTTAEKPGPDGQPAGAFVFAPPATPITDFKKETQWWKFVPGTNWRHPEGPQSDLTGREKYPVVQVTWADARAYAQWAGKRLPTEAEWECAARGGVERQRFPWGNDLFRDGKWAMNAWQGKFPAEDTGVDGFRGLAPVASYVANGYGLYDVTGNVAEWCNDWYMPNYYKLTARGSQSRDNPSGPGQSVDPDEPGIWKHVIRGGSWLSTEESGSAFRSAARGKLAPDVPLPTVGFRCAKDQP